MPSVYVKHPLTKEKKLECLSQYPNFKILDLRFKPDQLPEGDLVYGDKPPARKKVK